MACSESWCHQIFETRRNAKERTGCFSEDFYKCARKKDGTYQQFIDEIRLRAASDRFLRWTPLNKPFSIISDPAVTEVLANKVLEHLNKT